jgi:aminoglycoside phosphotransferase (APT) family kinase protein
MILEDLGDDLVGGKAIEHWAAALDTLVALQRSSVPLVESLLGLGLADRRLTVLETQIERFAEAVVQDLDLHRFLAAVPRLTGLCAELAASPIPFTLVHGDFHPDNVAVKDDRYVIFDWTDACIAHPFVDVATFLHNFGPPSTDAVIRSSLRERYLEGWSDLMPHADAVALFHRVEPLAAMHHAITSQTILGALDPSERMRFTSALPWWLDKALDSLDA